MADSLPPPVQRRTGKRRACLLSLFLKGNGKENKESETSRGFREHFQSENLWARLGSFRHSSRIVVQAVRNDAGHLSGIPL